MIIRTALTDRAGSTWSGFASSVTSDTMLRNPMSQIRVALTADDHFNLPKRSDEAKRILNWMLEDWKDRSVHLIGFAGDLADGPMTERDRAWLIDYIDRCALVAPVVVCDGNHEIELSLRNALSGRATKYPILVEDGGGVHVVDTAAGKIAVACLSFPKKAKLLAHVGPVSNEEADRIAGDALQDVCRGLGVKVERFGLPTVALVHGTVRGSKISADQPDRPLGLDIAPSTLTLTGADFYCVGHIHLAQEWEFNGVSIATPSSPFYTDWGEAKQEKGYILAEFDTEIVNAEPGTCAKWQRIPTPATPMLLLNGRFSDGKIELDYPHDGDGLEEIPDPVGADIRLRVSFNSDQRAAAKRAAAEMEAKLLQFGAVNVTTEPILIPITRSRIPQLATTPRLEDKWLLYCQAIGLELPDARKAVLLDCLRALQEEAAAMGLAMGTTGRAAPTLKKVQWKGFLKYPNLVEINFDELAGPLTTIIAPNEAGKSLAMQLIGPGLLYGDTSDRGSLDDLSVATDSFVRGVFDMGGGEYDLTQNANGKDRKGSVSLLKNKQPELSKAGRREYAEWASKQLLPRNVYDAIICQSGTESIINMKDGPRVELLLRVLGLEIYEALAEAARKRAAAVTATLSGVRSRIEEIGTVDLSALRAAVSSTQTGVDGWVELLSSNESALAARRLQAQEVEKRRAEYNALVSRRDGLVEQVSKLRARVTELTTKIEVNKEVADQAKVIEAAGVEVLRLGHELAAKATVDQELRLRYSEEHSARTALESRREDVVQRRDQSQATVADLTARLADVDTKRKDARALLKNAEVIRKAVTETASLQASLKTKEEELAQLRVKVWEKASALNDVRTRLSGITQRQLEIEGRINTAKPLVDTKEFVLQAVADAKRLTGNVDLIRTEIGRYKMGVSALELTLSTSTAKRISTLRDGHHDIVGGLAEPVARAMKALSDDDDVEAEEQDTPPRLIEVKAALEESEQKLRTLEGALRTAQTTAGNLSFVEKAGAETKECLATLETLLRESHAFITEGDQLKAEGEELDTAAVQAQSDVRWLLNEIEGYVPLVAKSSDLATAETRIQGLDEQRTSITTDLKAATTGVSELAAEVSRLDAEVGLRTDTLRRIEGEQASNESIVESLNKQMATVKVLAGKSQLLSEARTRIEELLHQKSGLDSELAMLEHEHGKLERQVDNTTLPEPIDLAPFEAAVTSARQSLTEYQIKLATAQKELADAETKEGRRQELASQVRGLEEQVSNWALLGQHLGKDALQKAEIDAASQTLVELTNDLLRAAGDTRHTLVSIETERLHSDGKRMVPCLNINVEDSEEGLVKESRRLSDAGKIIVGWPFSKALVLLGCQRAGLTGPTIMVDESTGVCDKENAPRVIAMLRRFADILKCRVIYVSQQADIQDLADSKIFINGGKVTFG